MMMMMVMMVMMTMAMMMMMMIMMMMICPFEIEIKFFVLKAENVKRLEYTINRLTNISLHQLY